jgi:hypothetical protein
MEHIFRAFSLRLASIRDLAAKERAGLEQNQDNRALNDCMQGADYFHPKNEDLFLGARLRKSAL